MKNHKFNPNIKKRIQIHKNIRRAMRRPGIFLGLPRLVKELNTFK